MRVMEKVTKVVNSETAMICNMCETRFKPYSDNMFYGFLDCNEEAKAFPAGTRLSFEICETCVKDKLFPLFKIPATDETLEGED